MFIVSKLSEGLVGINRNLHYVVMLSAAIASLLTQCCYIKHDSPKNLFSKDKKEEAVASFKALFVAKNSSEPPEGILEYLEEHVYIEKEKISILTLMKNPKYKNVTIILITNMIFLGLSGNFGN